MKVYLDDIRIPSNKDFVIATTCDEAINFLLTYEVTELDLDFDLGNDTAIFGKTGETVLRFMRRLLLRDPKFVLPKIWVHSGDTLASDRMNESIVELNCMAELSFEQRKYMY